MPAARLALVMVVALSLGGGAEWTPSAPSGPGPAPSPRGPGSAISMVEPAFFVAADGHDGNPGTEAAPFRTVAKGVSRLSPGATLYVKAGTYAEALIHTIPPGESWSRPVTVAAYPGHAVTLQPPAGAPGVLRFVGPQAYIVVHGFVLDAANVQYDGVKVTVRDADGLSAHHIRIQYCEVKNAPMQGILTADGAHSNEFIGLDVHDNGRTDFDHGFYVASDGNLVDGSDIYRNAGWGVHVYNENPARSANFNVIRGNRVFDNARVGARGPGILLSSGRGNRAYNNLVWGNQGGLYVAHATEGAELSHNDVWGNARYGILVRFPARKTRIVNNIVYRNGGPPLIDTGTDTTASHNLLYGNPRFVAEDAGDFRLRPDSPGVDAGTPVDAIPVDIQGAPRRQGRAPDLGAYESSGPAGAAGSGRGPDHRGGS